MFGLRLKAWMEAHLGRSRQKSSSQNQKSHRSPKDSAEGVVCGSSSGANGSTATTALVTISQPSLSPNPMELESYNNLKEHISTTAANLPVCPAAHFHDSPSAPCVQIQSESKAEASKAQLLPQSKLSGQQKQEDHSHQRSTCTRSSTTGSVNNSAVLLGSFSNSLSSPDTGYSTDGYSPKSVYPALSFESSGKSTPKSSYTISSLASSELLHSSKHTVSTCSANGSSNNCLESDQDSALLTTCSLLPPHSEKDKCDSQDSSARLIQLPSINPEPNGCTSFTSTPDALRLNGSTSSGVSCQSLSTQPAHHHKSEEPAALARSMVAKSTAKNYRLLQNVETTTSNELSVTAGSRNSEALLSSSNNCQPTNPFLYPSSDKKLQAASSHTRHRRSESDGESRAIQINGNSCGEQDGNSSSMVTALGGRNIKASLAFTANPIPEYNGFSVKNTFSICSPRRERTRIKTNPWILLNSQHGNDGGSGTAGNAENIVAHGRQPVSGLMATTKEKSPLVTTRSESQHCNRETVMAQSQSKTCQNSCACANSAGSLEKDSRDAAVQAFTAGKSDGDGDFHQGDSSALIYRVSTSTSASDSGKGSVDPGTNRNSTESSCLLSDSASTRNSIISQETESGCRSQSSSSSVTPEEHRQPNAPPAPFLPVVDQFSIANHHHSQQKTNQASCKVLSSSVDISKHDEPKSEQDVTSTSLTLPPDMANASVSSQTNVIMVDKETDILSDWANTDEDGEDDIETDQNEDEERVTPTPSTPDTNTGGRAIFPNSQSTSSATDIDFGDSSAATAASIPSTSIFRQRQHPQHSSNSSSGGHSLTTHHQQHHNHHHNVMRIPAQPGCYSTLAEHTFSAGSAKELDWNLTEPMDRMKPTVICPPGHALGIPNANISLSSLYSNVSDPSTDYNANKRSSSNAIARGALGFLRKIFRKTSCSSHRTSPGSDKVKMSRSSKLKDGRLDNMPSVIGLRSPLLTADALVSPNPLVARKTNLNGYFLTPTPNAFRRRSGNGTDSSDSKGSKHHKPVKTDIIRLPQGTLSPGQTITAAGQGPPSMFIQNNSSSSTASSKNTSLGPILGISTSTFRGATQSAVGNNILDYTNASSHANSTSASSVHSMSTSTSATSSGFAEHDANASAALPSTQNQSRLASNQHSYSSRQSPLKINKRNYQTGAAATAVLNLNASHSNNSDSSATGPPPPPAPKHNEPVSQSHPPAPPTREFSHTKSYPSSANGPNNSSNCPYDSPRMQNPQSHRINSPSFNNYSPIHRLVVTGGSHMLHRPQPACPSPTLLRQESAVPSASSNPFLDPSFSNNNRETTLASHNNNSNAFTITPVLINRPSPSPLINHQQQPTVTCSPRPSLSAGQPGFASPSPILRNPRYQYITSSNQNSPILNGPKRSSSSNVPASQQSQHAYYYHHKQGDPNGPPPFSTFSPKPPSRQQPTPGSGNNPFADVSSNSNHHNLNPGPSHRHRSGSFGCEFEVVNSPNLQQSAGNNNSSGMAAMHYRNNVLSRSHSYQTNQMSYYASSLIPQQPQNRTQQHPNSLKFNEPPLLMRTHLQNQNIRLNNFLMKHPGRFPQSESFQERIYETVDSEDEEEDDGCNDDDGDQHTMQQENGQDQFYYQNRLQDRNRAKTPESGLLYPNRSGAAGNRKSKTSKKECHGHGIPAARPPVPMALFGPNTFLSETETRLLEADREADRKYKRLINEAEALLREISAVKSQKSRIHRDTERLRVEECPQSDPLRRKAYDCYALRRLQQELAGCCASPPVLHRSRMNLQSPSTPTVANMAFFNPNPNVVPRESHSVNINHHQDNNQNSQF